MKYGKSCAKKTVSRSHLPILLSKVNGASLAKLLYEYYGVSLSEKEKKWFALDGKELKGSILAGDNRGQAVALAVSHEDRSVCRMSFFNGTKESEVVAVRTMLKSPLVSQKITMDALHLKPNSLIPIAEAGGIFLVGLKDNQAELLAEMRFCSEQDQGIYAYDSGVKKGHGREERRSYCSYNIEKAYVDKRWKRANFNYLIKVQRERTICNSHTHSKQIAYFLTNKKVQNQADAMELYQAIRCHWQVETANNTRDCILREDKLRCTITHTNQTIALCRTMVISILNKSDIKNRSEVMDYFADHFFKCIAFLKKIRFL
ncbi:MAG: ISAs1 family transposase [Chitinophagales bacterium]